MSFNAWANFSRNLNQVTLFYVSFTQLQQWTEFTMNDVEHYLMWTLWNYIIVNFTWILNDIWMDVKWFEWNFNKAVQRMNISSVIILLPSNPAQRLLWHSEVIYPVLRCTVTNSGAQCGARSHKTELCENCENAQNVQKAQNVQNAQNVHQHMLSTFRDKPGIPRVRTVPDSPGRARRPPQGPAAFSS